MKTFARKKRNSKKQFLCSRNHPWTHGGHNPAVSSVLQTKYAEGNATSGVTNAFQQGLQGQALITGMGGRVRSNPMVDDRLQALGARAATLGHDVFMRSDILRAPHEARNQRTFAHEAIHLAQQKNATGPSRGFGARNDSAEREADAGANALMAGQIPSLSHTESQPTLRMEMEFGPTEQFTPQEARHDPLWVENNVHNYFIPDLDTPEIVIIYEDGNVVTIPLKYVRFDNGPEASVTLFRRDMATGRLFPFQMGTDELMRASEGRGSETSSSFFQDVVPPAFNRELTPFITGWVDFEQQRLATIGFLKVFGLHAGGRLAIETGPVLPGAARSLGAGGSRLAASAPAQAIRAGAGRIGITSSRLMGGTVTAGANLLDQALTHGSDWDKYNWPSVGFDFIVGMFSQALVEKLFRAIPAPIFLKPKNLQVWKNFAYQQTIFLLYGTLVGVARSQIGNTDTVRTIGSQHLEGAVQAAKSGAVDSVLKSKRGLEWFPAGRADKRVILVNKILTLVIKAMIRQKLDVTPSSGNPEEQK